MPSSPHKPAPEFLYFDLGNVLLYFDHDRACRQVGAELGISRERVRQLVFESGLQLKYERGELTSAEFHEFLCHAAGPAARPDLERMLLAAAEIFEPNDSLLSLVESLHSAGRRLGVLSNTCEAHWLYVSRGRYPFLNRQFEVHALSYELKLLKPEPEIYAAAARLAGCRPERIFFTDDRPENIQAAREAGFDAVQFSTTAALAEELRARGALPAE